MGTLGHVAMGTLDYSMRIQGHGDTGTWRHRDMGTRGHGDTGTRGHEDQKFKSIFGKTQLSTLDETWKQSRIRYELCLKKP